MERQQSSKLTAVTVTARVTADTRYALYVYSYRPGRVTDLQVGRKYLAFFSPFDEPQTDPDAPVPGRNTQTQYPGKYHACNPSP